MARLVENLAHVRLGFTEPHRQKLRTLDADKVRLAFVGDRLGEESLTATRRTVEENTLGRRHAKLLKLFRVLHRILHSLLKFLLDGFQSSDVVPRDVRHLDDSLAKRGRVGGGESGEEVFIRNSHGVEDFRINVFIFQVNKIHLFTDALKRSFGTESSQVSTNVTVRFLGDLFKVNSFIKFHVLSVNAEHFQAADFVRNANVNLAIETAETTQRRIDRIRSVGRAHDDDVRTRLHAIHQSQELRHDAALDFTVRLLTLRSDRVDFINENDSRRILFSLFERLAEVGFRFTRELGHNFRTVDQEEEGAGFVRHRARNQRLAATRRTVEKDTLRGLDTDRLK